VNSLLKYNALPVFQAGKSASLMSNAKFPAGAIFFSTQEIGISKAGNFDFLRRKS